MSSSIIYMEIKMDDTLHIICEDGVIHIDKQFMSRVSSLGNNLDHVYLLHFTRKYVRSIINVCISCINSDEAIGVKYCLSSCEEDIDFLSTAMRIINIAHVANILKLHNSNNGIDLFVKYICVNNGLSESQEYKDFCEEEGEMTFASLIDIDQLIKE